MTLSSNFKKYCTALPILAMLSPLFIPFSNVHAATTQTTEQATTKASSTVVILSKTVSVVKINYVPGYGIAVWNSYNSNVHHTTGQYLPHGSSWKALQTVSYNGHTWYNVGKNQWIDSTYTKPNTTSIKPSVPTTIGETISGVVVIKYAGELRKSPSTSANTIRTLRVGETYKVFHRTWADGQTWYDLGGGQWVSSSNALPTELYANDYTLLGVPFINQYANGAPYGCEAASALQAIHWLNRKSGAWHSWNLKMLLNTMPISPNNNPYYGFAGSPYYSVPGVLQTIFPSAFIPWISHFAKTENLNGSSLATIKASVKAGHPVVTWVTTDFNIPHFSQYFWGQGLDNLHVVTVDGFTNESVHVMNPVLGGYWVANDKFLRSYNTYNFAVALK